MKGGSLREIDGAIHNLLKLELTAEERRKVLKSLG